MRSNFVEVAEAHQGASDTYGVTGPSKAAEAGRRGAELANAREAVRDPVKKAQRGQTLVRDVTQKVPVVRQAQNKDRRPHCKTRPNRDSKGKGGGKGFVPWC